MSAHHPTKQAERRNADIACGLVLGVFLLLWLVVVFGVVVSGCARWMEGGR